MIHRLRFSVLYALRNIQRGGRWTTLAILCITAGVATVVALRSLGLAVGDTLTGSVRVELKGDLLIRNDSFFGGFGSNDPKAFSESELARLLAWAEEKGAVTTAFMSGRNMQISKIDAGQFGRPSFVGSNFIDPRTYPTTHKILAIDPPDVPLSELFTGGDDVVISDNLAAQSNLSVGDSVRVSGTQAPFTVRGIVSVAEESSVLNFLNAFFGFAYFDLASASATINESFAPNRIGVLFPDPPSAEEAERLSEEIMAIVPEARVTVTYDLLLRYDAISQYLSDFVVVMGLGALLIGGVGIMNTMLVLVRRRTNEIAAVKTFGLQGHQVAMLFLTEGLLLGGVGSLLGLVAGVALSLLVNEYGSVFLRQPLIWRIYPEALIFGFSLGMVVSAIFGVAPILTAIKVRPGIILRPNETHLVALGIVQSVMLLLFVIICLGLVVGHILQPSLELAQDRTVTSGLREESARDRAESQESEAASIATEEESDAPSISPYVIGLLGVGATFLVFLILIGLLWLIIAIIGRLPSFGRVTLRLALRNLSTNRLRTAITLLALSAGMFALSSITFVGEGTRELLNFQLSRAFGGNVLVFPFSGLPSAMVKDAIEGALSDISIGHRTMIKTYETAISSVNGEAVEGENALDFSAIDSDNPEIYAGQNQLHVGRMFSPEDRGQPRIILPFQRAASLGVSVGDRIALEGAPDFELEVAGIFSEFGGLSFGEPSGLVPTDAIPSAVRAEFAFYAYEIPEDEVNRALTELSSLIFALAMDVRFIDGVIARLIDQFSAIPTVVALLSLFAASVIMTNTVALSTLERRRQIGILKAIGLNSRRVLQVMFIESSLIGLLSAGLGIGMSALALRLLSEVGGIALPLPADAQIVAAALLVAAVLIGWVATFFSARVALKERVMNVLRYD